MSPPKSPEQPCDLGRVHERLDDLFIALGGVRQDLALVSQRCSPCQDALHRHQEALYGNGKEGLLTRFAKWEVADATKRAVLTGVGAALCAVAGAAGAILGALLR